MATFTKAVLHSTAGETSNLMQATVIMIPSHWVWLGVQAASEVSEDNFATWNLVDQVIEAYRKHAN